MVTIMTNHDFHLKHIRNLNIVWGCLSAFLLAFVVVLMLQVNALRAELDKPLPKTTMAERHKIVGDFLAVEENQWALRQHIGCKERLVNPGTAIIQGE